MQTPPSRPTLQGYEDKIYPPANVPTNVKTGVDLKGLNTTAAQFASQFATQYPNLQITSGYRDVGYNRRVGGAEGSQHIQGNALDVGLRGLSDEEKAGVYNWARANGATGIGYYPRSESAHFDFRKGAPAAWGGNYSRTSLPNTPPWFQKIAEQHFAGEKPQVQTAQTPLPTPRPAAANAPATTELTAKASPTAPTAPMPTQEQAFSPTLTTEQKAPALQAITDAVKAPPPAPSTGDVAAAAAAPGVVAPSAAPTPAVGAPAAKEEPPPNLPPPAAAPARTATAAPAAAPPRITIPPAPASTLGDRMISAMGPRGAGRSAYIDPSTQHQILNPGGSGEEAMGITRDLGPLSRQTPARAAPAPQRPAAGQPPGAQTAAPPAAPVSPQPSFGAVRTPRSDFSGPVAPTPFAGSMDPLTGAPNLSGPTPPAPNEAGALAPQPPPPAPTQGPNLGGSLSPFTIGGVQFFPPGAPQQQQPPPPWPTGPVPPAPPPPQTVDQQFGQLPWSPFFGQDPQQRQLALAPFQPDWQSFNATG